MKSLRDYLEESQHAADNPVEGDTFAINIREECLIESVVVESRNDGVVIAADDRMIELLESYGYTFEETCMECGSSGCGCGSSEQYSDIADQDSGEYDQEGSMAKDELLTMIRSARKLIGMLDNNDNMPEWTQKKITKATDYADTAADYISSQKERGVMEGDSESNPVVRAILHRIMMQHTGMLAQYGPQRVMDAVDELADRVNIGPDDEIGTSDVSGYVRQVQQMLDNSRYQGIAEGQGATTYTVAYKDPKKPGKSYSTQVKATSAAEAKAAFQEWDNTNRFTYLGSRPDVDTVYEDQGVAEAEYQGRKVPLGKPMQGDVKKSKVYVKNPQGNVVKVNFGDPNMTIKKSNPARRKSFRARHNCDNPGPRTKARYWSCRAW